MEAERWREIERLYNMVLEQAPTRRAALLEQTCGADDELRREVESLLGNAEGAAEYIDAAQRAVALHALNLSTVTAGRAGGADLPETGETVGAVIGRYTLLRKIGEGGMGEVWLAEQKEPVRRSVALKLVKAGMNRREVIARFESERQALALMDHPAIAKVFDADATPQGAPYFVMEYVAGVPITNYCDESRLNIRQRLELFLRVCEGVQHAHQKAIIHRDLKPSNILVVAVDGRPAPKIIDFGIAKVLTQKLTSGAQWTRAGALVGTPQYMSPEQAHPSIEGVDTRADVYSLGVIFYELLAGSPPFELRDMAIEEFLGKLREGEPAKPSAKIRSGDKAAQAEVARKRRAEPLELAKQLRGDLDSIAQKALERNRSRRYNSPSDFAADIGRHLRNEAVLAVSPSAGYRAARFARRHRLALATAGAFILVLILASGISIRLSVRANREAAVAQAVNDFLQNDLLSEASPAAQSGPNIKPDRDLKVRTALDRAAVRINGRFARQPAVEAAIRETIGETYFDLGLYAEARTQLERALELERRVFGEENAKTLTTISRLGALATKEGRYTEAEGLFSRNSSISRRVLGPEHRDTLSAMNALADVYYREGKYPQAEALDSRIVEIERRTLGTEDPETLRSMTNLANACYGQSKYAEAEALNSQVLKIRRRVLGPEHRDTITSMNNLAADYTMQGQYLQAESLFRQTLEIERRLFGSDHPDTLKYAGNLAEVYDDEGEYAKAEALLNQTLEIKERVLGPEHPETLISLSGLAHAYSSQGRYKMAEALYSRTLEIRRRVLGADHPYTLYVLADMAAMYQREGKYAAAETYASRALERQRITLGPEQPDTIDSATELALARESQGKFEQSEALARVAAEFNRRNRPDDWRRFFAESLFGASLAGEKNYREAEAPLVEGYTGMLARKDRMAIPDRYLLSIVREWIVRFYRASGNPEGAAAWESKQPQGPEVPEMPSLSVRTSR